MTTKSRHLPKSTAKRKVKKFRHDTRITLATASLLGVLGGWNLIANLENSQAEESSTTPAPALTAVSPIPESVVNSIKLPPIKPLPNLGSVPTLVPILEQKALSIPSTVDPSLPAPTAISAQISVAPLPTLAPLPPMPQLPTPPPPPPVVVAPPPAQSGGS